VTLVFLGIGSNLERDKNIVAAVRALEQEFETVRLSKVYESEAAGFIGPPFYNLVASIYTDKGLVDLQQWCKQVEQHHGRAVNAERFCSKTLDIDILLYGNLCCELTPQSPKLPREEILHQAYVLKPMAELAPLLKHPETQKSFRQHWREFNSLKAPNGLMGSVAVDWTLVPD